jgi:hypothetical protein
MLRLLLSCLMLGPALLGLAAPAAAQSSGFEPMLRLEANGTPLAEVLRRLATQAGIDIVFAERTVDGRSVTGRYVGDDVQGALRTVLRDSGLQAEKVRPRQYVIVPAAIVNTENPRPTVRGILEGVVVDAENGEVLPGANVLLLGLAIGAATNTAGYFALPGLPAGYYPVRVSFVGYESVELELPVYPASKLERPVIRLNPKAHQGGAVVVEGSGNDRSDLDVAPGTARIGIREVSGLPSMMGEGDLFGAFEWMPGVTRAGEAGGELVVRGAEAQYNRYILDGAPVIHPWHAFGLFSVFQPEALKSVRLHKGSYPAEHGGALSAVVDLEMRDGSGDEPSGMVSLSPVSIRGVAEAPLTDRLSIMFTARRTWMDLLLTPRLRVTSEGSLPSFAFASALTGDAAPDQQIGYHFFDLGTKLTWHLADGQRLSLSYYEGGDRLDAVAPISSFGAVAPDPQPGGYNGDDAALKLGYSWGNRVLSGRYHGLVGEQLFLTGGAYFSRYAAREQSARAPVVVGPFQSDYGLSFAEIGMRLDADYYHSLEHQLRAGAAIIGRDFTSTLLERHMYPNDSLVRRDHLDRVRALEFVGYVQDTWQPTAAWQFQPGVRVEYFGLGGYLSVNPRLHVRHALGRGRLNLRAGISRQTQPLHRLRDRNAQTHDLVADRWLPASDRIRPASGWQAGVGVEWLPARSLSLNAEIFGRHLKDILLPLEPADSWTVAPGRTAATLVDQFVAGTGRAAGVELSAEAHRRGWRGNLAYSFARAQERVPGSRFRPARYDAPHQLEAFVIGGSGPWTVSVAGTIRSGYPVTLAEAFEGTRPGTAAASLGALNNGRLPLYARADVSVSYEFRLVGLVWNAQAQAYNVLNRRNAVGSPFAQEVTVVPSDKHVYDLPILPMISLRARW